MKSKERPYVLFVAEAIYNEVSKIKKKIQIFQILMLLKILLAPKLLMKLAQENFTISGLIN